jgi:hypothetical protein
MIKWASKKPDQKNDQNGNTEHRECGGIHDFSNSLFMLLI